jgi:hypothetical protein
MTRVLALAWMILFSATIHSLAARKQNMTPESLLENIAWSFAEPIPDSPSDLVSAVAAYHAEINYPFDKKALTMLSPLSRLDATYSYKVEIPGKTMWEDVQWKKIPVVVRIDGGGKRLTYADILWQLHKEAHKNLKDDDHHYFEGLFLLPQPLESGVPAYEVYIGS